MFAGNDFFGANPVGPAVDSNSEDINKFAQAIAGRFSNPDKTKLIARLSPTRDASPTTPQYPSSSYPLQLPSPATPLARLTIDRFTSPRHPPVASSSSSPSDFTVVTASSLAKFLRTPHVLVLDIRPHSAYSAARLPHAISLSVPSTLLKRPAFDLEKLAAMLPSVSARSRFQSWNEASRILVYDADSSILNDGSNLLGLLRKFRLAGFTREVAWLQGGIQSLWRENRHLVDERCLSDDEDDGETSHGKTLRARDLPQAAFQQQTTMLRSSPTLMSIQLDGHASQSSQMAVGGTARFLAANPFYDNIRQNLELSQGITERIPLRLSPSTASRAKELPFAWLRSIATTAGQDESTEALAMQFYRIELGEQRRLQGIMAHHSMQSGTGDAPKKEASGNDGKRDERPFPYSIVAGVEKGTKNRYRNIWPFEHSRVHLKGQKHDDYVNASFVQPLVTRRKFIATQGPLPSTFVDFWSVVWEQDVHVILMLTKECEAGHIKCGKYWADGNYGPYHIKCTMTTGAKEEDDGGGGQLGDLGGGFFNVPPKQGSSTPPVEDKEHNFTIRRVFELSHSDYPEPKPRVVTQLQYIGWPDMDVPVSPRSLLQLMFEVDDLADQSATRDGYSEKQFPVLLHCSAGVGRTGAFIMIDSVLDGVRHEIRKRVMAREARKMTTASAGVGSGRSSSESEAEADSDIAMDVDSTLFARERNVFPSVHSPTSTAPSKALALPPTPQHAPVQEQFREPVISQFQPGPVATLHMGGDTSIHVPLVPSDEPASQRQTLPSSSRRPSEENAISVHTPSNSLLSRRLLRPYLHRPLTSDFTVADADSMFMSPNPNPAFAMDVEASQQVFQQARNASSSSGEGNGSSGDKASGSTSSGSASDGRFTGPLQKAFASLSSTDDARGSPERLKPSRFRLRTESSDGKSAGEFTGGSASESSARSSTGSGNIGYLSTSSLGLGDFSGMAMSSPTPTSGCSSPTVPPRQSPTSLVGRSRQRSPRKLSLQKPSLLAPKPLHLKSQMPELTEEVETSIQSDQSLLSKLGETHGSMSSVRSNLSSSSSMTDSPSLLSISASGHTTDTYDTPHSMHKASRSPSAEKEDVKLTDHTVFDYTEPRDLHGDDSPPLLSTLQEPLRQILEDMRKQRMSLCQSLRQYVFVHNAIIEGALIIAQEERKHFGLAEKEIFDNSPSQSSPTEAPRVQLTGKRGASPTELPKEDRKGEVALVKRPSVKRGKSISSGESSVSA